MTSMERPRQGLRRRNLIAICVAAVVGLVVGLVVGAVVLGGDDNPDTTASEQPPSTEDSAMSTERETTSTTSAPAEVVPVPTEANPALQGTDGIEFPSGTPGELSVVTQAATLDDSGSVAVVVRNMTESPLTQLTVTGSARDTGGALVGSGESQGLHPTTINPGEIAIGYVYFSFDGVPEGAAIELAATGEEPGSFDALGPVDLAVTEFNVSGTSVVGALRKDTDAEVRGPIGVSLVCFDDANVPIDQHGSFAQPDTAPPGATVTFSIDFFTDPPCPRFLLGGSGYTF